MLDLITNQVPDKSVDAVRPADSHAESVQQDVPQTVFSPQTTIGPDPKALASLESRLQASLPPAYAAFMETFQSIAEDIPDERARFKVALKTTHSNVDQILSAIDQLVTTMESAHQDFNQKLDSKMQDQHTLENTISAKIQALKQMQEELHALEVQKQENQSKIGSARAGFESALKTIMDRLSIQKSRISSMR